jgi:hypothetical protein
LVFARVSKALGHEFEHRNTAAGRKPELIIPNPKLRLREQVGEVMRFKHYSMRTEETYWGSIRQFILWVRNHLEPGAATEKRSTPLASRGGEGVHTVEEKRSTPHPGPLPSRGGEGDGTEQEKQWRHPREMGVREVHAFLT